MPGKTTSEKPKKTKKESNERPERIKKKIVLLGDNAVGKTSLIRKFVFDQFDDSYIQTIGTKITKKDLLLTKDGKDLEISLMIWDLIGLRGFTAMHANAFMGVNGALLVSDLRRDDTLNSYENHWIPLLFKVVQNVPLIFLGNKADLVHDEDAKLKSLENLVAVASRYNDGVLGSLPEDLSPYYLTSAKTGENVEKAFQSMGHLLLSPELLEDPMREISERKIAEGMYKEIDTSTSTGAIDALIMDFSKGFKDKRKAMSSLRLEFIRSGLDLRHPTRDSLLKTVDYLAESEAESKSEKTVRENRERRLKLIEGIEEYEIYKYRKIGERE